MFKIGINSAPRITTSEVTETQESQQQNVEEQIAPPQSEPVSAANSSIRSEAMFSTMAMRAQLTQQLSSYESMKRNPMERQSDRVQKQIYEMEQAINKEQITNTDNSEAPTSETDRRRRSLDNIQKFLDILRNMDPKI